MLNIVIPMAGRGSRFINAGYITPKPFINIYSRPMIEYVINNITPETEHRFIFICLKDQLEKYSMVTKLNYLAPGCIIVSVSSVTEGAACTVLLARDYINNSDPLMIANSDQYADIDINEYLATLSFYDGLIMTLYGDSPAYSYVKSDKNGYVSLVREKEVISNTATVGIYNFKYGSDFVNSAMKMISKNIRVNNEFYLAPVYNELINDNKKIVCYNAGSIDAGVYSLGVPDDLFKFINNPVSLKAREKLDRILVLK